MGCEMTRENSRADEETAIQSVEKLLGFDMVDCKDIDNAFSRFANGNYIRHRQLEVAFETIRIPAGAMKNPPLSDFLKSIEEGEKGYPLKKMVCSGILLGKGTPLEKGELFMNNYDRDCSGEIDGEEFKSMINDMFEVSVKLLVELAKANDRQMVDCLNEYYKKLKRAQKIFHIYVQFIMTMGKEGEIITRTNFLDTFRDSTMAGLATTHGIRKLILDLYNMQSHDN
jgi:Ca2+-binding EF-hand superfamily protein